MMHLSDLHYTLNSWNQNIVIKSFLQDLENYIVPEKIQPDFVLFTGDIVYSGKKEEFECFRINFLSKISAILELPLDRFIFCPGNHDVDRSSIDLISQAGLTALLKDRDTTNNIIRNLTHDSNHLDRLANFNAFIDAIEYKESRVKSVLHSSYQFEINSKKIGFSALNSSWCAQGGEDDYGKLIIGEVQIENAFSEISSCDIKICLIHHPFDSLKEFDKRAAKYFINQNYDFILSGHEHDTSPFHYVAPKTSCLNLRSGCLYGSRDYYNGYSLIDIDPSKSTCSILYRTYFESRKSFSVGEDVTPKGTANFELKHNSILTIDRARLDFIANLQDRLIPKINNSLAINYNLDEISFKKAFVVPTLSNKAEDLKESTPSDPEIKEEISLDEILSNENHYMIAGKKESGKTTLLNHIVYRCLEIDTEVGIRFPILIDYVTDLKNSPDMFDRTIKNFIKSIKGAENYNDLKSDPILLVIDNFDHKFPRKARELDKFLNENINIKAILGTEETVLDSLAGRSATVGGNFKKVYIQSFKRGQARTLVKRICGDIPFAQEELVLNKIMDGLDSCFIPRTPFMISAALSVYRNDTSFSPVNKVSLIEKLIEILLEKHSIVIDKSGLDYRQKEDYLCFIASTMAETNIFSYEMNYFEEMTITFLKNIGSDAKAVNVVNYFTERKIFFATKEDINFKLKSFCEYFVAKQMLYSNLFCTFIFHQDRYLSFFHEIEYFAGLKRDDPKILEELGSRMISLFNQSGLDIDVMAFDKLTASFSILDSMERQDLLKSISQNRNDYESRDESFDKTSKGATQQDQLIKKEISDKVIINFAHSLILYGKVLRCSELIKVHSIKKKHTEEFVKYLAKSMLAMVFTGDKILVNLDIEKMSEENQTSNKLNHYLQTIVPYLFSVVTAELFPSQYFKEIYVELYKDHNSKKAEKLLYLALMFHVLPRDFVTEVKALIRSESHDSSFIEALTLFLIYNFTSVKHTDEIAEETLELISDLSMKRARNKNERSREKFKAGLKKRRLYSHIKS